MKDCIFCRIANHQEPAFIIYEDKDFIAFLDHYPWVEGHTLVIPKKHYRWVWDMPSNLAGEYFKVVHKIANHYRKIFQTEFVMSRIYGYDVPHAHIHLFPNARGKITFYPKQRLGRLSLEKGKELAAKLRM